MVKTLEEYYRHITKNKNANKTSPMDFKKGSLYVLKVSTRVSSVLCHQAAQTLLSRNMKTKDVAYSRGNTLFFQREKCWFVAPVEDSPRQMCKKVFVGVRNIQDRSLAAITAPWS